MNAIMDHSDQFLPDFYDPSYPNGNFIGQNHLESPLDDLAGFEPFSKKKESKPHYFPNNPSYAATYPPTTTFIHGRQPSRPWSQGHWSSHSFGALDSPTVPTNIAFTSQAPPASQLPLFDFEANDDDQGSYPDRKGHLLSPLNSFQLQNLPHNNYASSSVMPQGVRETSSNFSPPHIPSSPDSHEASPYLSFIREPWMSPASEIDTDEDSLASSISSLSPDALDIDTFPGEIPAEDEDLENFYSRSVVSPRQQSIYHPLDQYPLHDSPPSSHDGRFISAAHPDDDDLSPLPYSPPSLAPLHFISPSESEYRSTKKIPTYNSLNNYYSFDYDTSTPVPSSPSRRRSATLPELEPTSDSFGLHKSTPAEAPPRDIDMDVHPHWLSLPGGETDDDLIPVELASKNYIPDPFATVPTTSTGTRSLLLWDHDQNDRSDFPTPRSPSPERFYLDPTVLAECGDEEMQKVYELRQRTAKSEKWERERCRELSALLRLKLDERGILGGGDCHHHQNGSRSCSDLPGSSSRSSDSVMVHQPQPSTPFSSTQNPILIPTPSSPSSTTLSTSEKPIAQPEGPKHKIKSMAQLVASMLFHRQSDALRRYPSRKTGFEPTYHHSSHTSPMRDTGMKVLTPRSRLSEVILPEELEVDEQGVEVESDRVKVSDDDSHIVTPSVPPYSLTGTQ